MKVSPSFLFSLPSFFDFYFYFYFYFFLINSFITFLKQFICIYLLICWYTHVRSRTDLIKFNYKQITIEWCVYVYACCTTTTTINPFQQFVHICAYLCIIANDCLYCTTTTAAAATATATAYVRDWFHSICTNKCVFAYNKSHSIACYLIYASIHQYAFIHLMLKRSLVHSLICKAFSCPSVHPPICWSVSLSHIWKYFCMNLAVFRFDGIRRTELYSKQVIFRKIF